MNELVKMGRNPSSSIVNQISVQIQEDVDKGPITQIREQYAVKAAVERDVVKMQNSIKKLSDEQKTLFRRGDQLDRRIDSLKDVFLRTETFMETIKIYAPLAKLDSLRKTVDRCALQNKTDEMFGTRWPMMPRSP